MKKWERALKGELIFLTVVLLSTSLVLLLPKFKHTTYPHQIVADAIISILCAVISVIALVLYLLRKRSCKITKISRWLNIVTVPFALAITWLVITILISTRLPINQMIAEIIMAAVYLVIFLPVVIIDYSAVQNWIGRIIAVEILFMVMLSAAGAHLPSFVGTMLNSGFVSAIAGLIAAMVLAKKWGFSSNPNLKVKANSFSWLTCILLLLFTAIFIFWNVNCGNGNNLFSVLFKVGQITFKPTWRSLFTALEAGILEESVRYLTVLILLVKFAHSKYRIEWTVFLSAAIFGLSHLSNLGWQKWDATFNQVAYAGAIGLVFCILYLYTGQIWVSMFFHFLNDFLVMSQPGGMEPGTWSGSINDWLDLLISVVIPAAIAIWMLVGKRKQVMWANSECILNKNL